MVAGTISMDKTPTEVPVTVTQPAMSESTTSTSKRHVILTSWASVATALLIMLLIGGAFYTADLKSRECSQSSSSSEHNTKDYSKTYDEGDKETKEDIHIDEEDKTELIITKSEDGNIEMLTATDFNKKITASYVPAVDQCFLLAGTDVDFLTQWEKDEDEKVEVGDDVKQKDYKVSGNLVTDKSVLPSVMRTYCDSKPTYWMQPTDESDMEQVRQKRDQCYCKWCYYYYCYGGNYICRYCWWAQCAMSYCQ